MNKISKSQLIVFGFVIIVALVFYLELKPRPSTSTEPVIEFWQYWTGAEKKPLEDLVNKFNSEDHDFKVKMLTVSLPRKKILMAITGGVPPDLVHLDGDMVSDFALRNSLIDLRSIRLGAQGSGLRGFLDKFIPIYIEMLNVDGKQAALPLMPTCEAMHINKGLLDKYNLKIPTTLDDIVYSFDKFLNTPEPRAQSPEPNQAIAWLPSWPPWAGKFIPTVFGGRWGNKDSDGHWRVTANSPENIAAWNWVQENFATKIPRDKLAAYTEGFNAYQSPDNPFYVGRIAIQNNGVWEKNLASIFAPKLDIAVAPFPVSSGFGAQIGSGLRAQTGSGLRARGSGQDGPRAPSPEPRTTATQVAVDALAIPRGARQPELAAKFMHWLLEQENLEYLALGQKKFTPLKNHSQEFITSHPNPYIQVFIDLANSPNASYFPHLKFAARYKREIKAAYTKVLRMEVSAKEALDELQSKFSN